ncbi:helix-turn-helix domain-containing protein [Cyanobacteria bacterium FACHB-63]|nr:helix-turn-helix domain-containing protein [Cyanobacteria bacterium FACHB-63]
MGNSAQREQLKAIGIRLGKERQKKSMSLEEIAVKTYIPQRLLVAIEEANLDRLPEPVFVQGFIRRYGDAVGLDGSALSKEFTVDLSPLPAPTAATLITAATPQPPLQPVVQAPTSPKSAAPITPPPAPKPPESERLREQPKVKVDVPRSKETNRLPLIALGGALSLGVIGVLAITLFDRPAERRASTTATAGVAQPSQPPIVSPSPAPVASTPASPTPTRAAGVKMNVNEESWVEVVVDGKTEFEGTLPKGTQRSWSGKSQVVVTAGNAGGVSLSYNNATFKPMGSAGEVQTVTFPPTP